MAAVTEESEPTRTVLRIALVVLIVVVALLAVVASKGVTLWLPILLPR